ncbi:MAG: hypothetical protein DRI44_03930 [Chlamydiae bacterium]|nr:MAG: hypothetical protein DRI44_03930 [Chlamydiota bacterium]
MSKKISKKVLLIGWDAADWKIINPLLDAGKMPALEFLVNGGVMGNLATLNPPLSPMLWTSIATGMRAYKHGILGFTEPNPKGKKSGIRPVSSKSRKVKAIWNILSQKNFKTNVVGWWPSHPAEPINGVCVSNFYHHAHTKFGKPWPMAPGTIYPERLEKTLAELRVHPGELTEAHILPFVPDAAKIDQDKDKRLASLGKIIAECSSVHAASTWIMENEPWDFMAVYYDAIDHFCHGFMNYYPPKMVNINKDLFEMYKNVVESGYRFHDMMLGRLITLAGDDTTIILISDHGFHSDHLRPKEIPNEPAGPAVQHRPLGIFVMNGAGVKKDERIYGATLLDIAPTILTLFGLPIGKDVDGHVLAQCFEDKIYPEMIDSWENVEGNDGMLPNEVQEDPFAEQAVMEQMIALGYIEPPDENNAKNVERTVREAQYNLARVYLDAGRSDKALTILKKLHKELPNQRRFAFHLAKCYQRVGKLKECREIIENVIKNEQEKARETAEELKKNKEVGKKETKEERKIRLEKEEKMRERRDFVSKAQLDLLRGSLLMAEKQNEEALVLLLNAEKAEPRLPSLHQQIGRLYLRMKRWDDAERAFLRALEIDPDSSSAYHGIAVVCLRQKRFSEAAEAALRSVGIIHQQPLAHFHLGVALIRLGKTEQAIQAFEIAVSMKPGLIRAHRWLSLIYRQTGNRAKADVHHNIVNTLFRKIKPRKSNKD